MDFRELKRDLEKELGTVQVGFRGKRIKDFIREVQRARKTVRGDQEAVRLMNKAIGIYQTMSLQLPRELEKDACEYAGVLLGSVLMMCEVKEKSGRGRWVWLMSSLCLVLIVGKVLIG